MQVYISPRVQVNDIVKCLLLQLINVHASLLVDSLCFVFLGRTTYMVIILCILVFAIGSEGTVDKNYCFN